MEGGGVTAGKRDRDRVESGGGRMGARMRGWGEHEAGERKEEAGAESDRRQGPADGEGRAAREAAQETHAYTHKHKHTHAHAHIHTYIAHTQTYIFMYNIHT